MIVPSLRWLYTKGPHDVLLVESEGVNFLSSQEKFSDWRIGA